MGFSCIYVDEFLFFLDEARLQVELLELMHAHHRRVRLPSIACLSSVDIDKIS